MPVEFLSDREVAGYGRFVGAPSAAELDRWFFLDDADKALISRRVVIIIGLGSVFS